MRASAVQLRPLAGEIRQRALSVHPAIDDAALLAVIEQMPWTGAPPNPCATDAVRRRPAGCVDSAFTAVCRGASGLIAAARLP